jgi:hypothetical protein
MLWPGVSIGRIDITTATAMTLSSICAIPCSGHMHRCVKCIYYGYLSNKLRKARIIRVHMDEPTPAWLHQDHILRRRPGAFFRCFFMRIRFI